MTGKRSQEGKHYLVRESSRCPARGGELPGRTLWRDSTSEWLSRPTPTRSVFHSHQVGAQHSERLKWPASSEEAIPVWYTDSDRDFAFCCPQGAVPVFRCSAKGL